MVTGHAYDGTATTVTAQDPENPQYGNIQMKFTGPDPELRQWIINDGNGGQTTVMLGDLTTGWQSAQQPVRHRQRQARPTARSRRARPLGWRSSPDSTDTC